MAKVGGVHGQDMAKQKQARNETKFREKHGIKENHGHQKKLQASEETEKTAQQTTVQATAAAETVKPVVKAEETAAPKVVQQAPKQEEEQKDPLFGFVADTIAAANAIDKKATEFIA